MGNSTTKIFIDRNNKPAIHMLFDDEDIFTRKIHLHLHEEHIHLHE